MGFWQNVETEMDYLGMTRKELAAQAQISYTGIGLGLERNSMPGADTAMRISEALGVSIEYLLTGTEKKRSKKAGAGQNVNWKKYRAVLDDLDRIPDTIKNPICQMIHRIAEESGR